MSPKVVLGPRRFLLPSLKGARVELNCQNFQKEFPNYRRLGSASVWVLAWAFQWESALASPSPPELVWVSAFRGLVLAQVWW